MGTRLMCGQLPLQLPFQLLQFRAQLGLLFVQACELFRTLSSFRQAGSLL